MRCKTVLTNRIDVVVSAIISAGSLDEYIQSTDLLIEGDKPEV
jgi:hypothetical protein